MIRGRKYETDPRTFEAAAQAGRLEFNLDAHPFEYVGRTDAATYRAIPMLGDRNSGRGRDQRRAGRDIERPGAIAARACSVQNITIVELERTRPLSHRPHSASKFAGGLALQSKRNQKSRDQRVRHDVIEDLADYTLRLGSIERAALEDDIESLAQTDHAP